MQRFNFFSALEHRKQENFRGARDRLVRPLVDALIAWRVQPDGVSALGMLCLVPFGLVVTLAPPTPATMALACGLLFLHVILDGLDGPLARRLGREGHGGALVDMMCDHCGMIVVTLQLSLAGLIDGSVAGLYVITYTLMIAFTIWLNALGRPFQFIFRTKYFLYAFFAVYAGTGVNFLTPVLLLFSTYHLLPILTGYHRVREELKKLDRRDAYAEESV
ncbi:MAG: CDP-alcohol phosphatidyltransferase family protein [Verrucomicrobiota bacterium]